jgi:hypothetical protein
MIDLNDVDGPLCEIKYMAEIAAELTDNLDSNEATPGFFQISLSEGNLACRHLFSASHKQKWR